MIDPFHIITIISKWVGSTLTYLLPKSLFKDILSYWIYDFFKIMMILIITFSLFHFVKKIKYFNFITNALKRKDLIGILSGTVLGIFTPVCSCSVTPIYASLINKGASKQSSSAFLFSAPAINEFALALCFSIAGIKGGLIYLLFGVICAILTGYIGGKWQMDQNFICCETDESKSFLQELFIFLKKLSIPLLIGALFASIIVKFNYLVVDIASQFKNSILLPVIVTLIGIPLDISAMNVGSIILPLQHIGIGFGTIISLLMAITVASVPEYVVISKLIGGKNTIVLFLYYSTYCILIGYILNIFF
jgi:uncharacterized membrane protein YraQ (UPF0718 family)